MPGPAQPDLPAPVKEALGEEAGRTLIATRTDLSLDGEDRTEWLVISDRTARIVDEAPPRVLRETPLEEAERFRAYGAVGSGFLQVRIDGVWIDLLRYSMRLADRFATLARQLEQLRARGPDGLFLEDPLDEERCALCGTAMVQRADEASGAPRAVCPRCGDRLALATRLWRLIRPHRTSAAALMGLLLLGVLLSLVPPKLQQYLVDDVLHVERSSATNGAVRSLALVVAALAATRVFAGAVNWVKGRLQHRVGAALTVDLRNRLVDKLHELQIAFFDQHQVGTLVSQVTRDTEAIQGLINQLTSGLLLQALQFAGVGLMLFTLDARLALYTLLPAPLVVAGSLLFWRHLHPKNFRLHDSNAKQAAGLAGVLLGMRVVKAFGQEERERARFREASDYLERSRVDAGYTTTAYGTSMSLIFSLGGFIVWYVGGKRVLGDRMTLGELMAFLAYLSMFYRPLTTLSRMTTWMSGFVAASSRFMEVLETPVEIAEPKDPIHLESAAGEVRFDGVSFGYERHTPVLENLSFEIPRGQMVGIVGRSGSGKTTLIHLLCRFYDVQEGRITIDGHDVRGVAREDLRRQIGLVLQETFLFRGTVWENVVYGRSDATEEQAIAAARAARAHDFIMKMPLGYETPIRERGVNLSGGERQRIAIARALLYDPAILVLDEATSNLDTESERAIHDAIYHLTRERTTIVIAHRLSTLRHADRLLVFQDGKLEEDGTHAELISRDGTYARLLRMQSRLAEQTSLDELVETETTAADMDPFEPTWLSPASTSIRRGETGTVDVEVDGRVHRGVTALLAFPTRPDSHVSVRSTEPAGEEIGIIRDLSVFDGKSQEAIRHALARRYHLRTIEAIDRMKLELGMLWFEVRTNRGRESFAMRFSQSEAHDFGRSGKLITDVHKNQYVIPDVDALPKRQRWLFQRYVYW